MTDKDPQDTEILAMIGSGGENGIDPQKLIDGLLASDYGMPQIIEALQRAMERGKILLSSEGMVISRSAEYADAA